MQLEEAASRIRQLSNFFDGLKYLEEVVEAARSADQLQKERNALADQAGRELAAVQEKLSREKAEASSAIAKLKDQAKRLEDTYAAKSSELEEEFSKRRADLLSTFNEQQAGQKKFEDDHLAYVAAALEQKAALEADLAKLQKALDNLKSKVGGML